jgi:histidine triad (HIT) family protein
MFTHEPDGYVCPFCRIIRLTNDSALSDIVCQTKAITAFLGLDRWAYNPVDVLVVPNEHYENLYSLPFSVVPDLHRATRTVALALKAVYQCDGISTRQHNEPAGDQDVWHYHVHVTPRFTDDVFYRSKKVEFPEEQRLHEASRLQRYIAEHQKETLCEE